MSKLGKKVKAAWDYYPYGISNMQTYEDWIYSNVFAAKCLNRPDTIDISVLSGLGIYKPRNLPSQPLLKKLLEEKDTSFVSVDISSKKHSDYCTGRSIIANSTTDRGKIVSEKIELAWLLWDLARALDVVIWKMNNILCYGYTSTNELVFIAASRFQSDKCFKMKIKVDTQ